jgi:DNA transformation protein
MAIDEGLVDWLGEELAPLGTIRRKRLFGGAALDCDGISFAILAFDAVWFKADGETDALWDAIGAERFSVERKSGKVQTLNFRRIPDEAYDDADALREWAALAIAAGRRALPGKLAAKARRRKTRPAS